MHEIQRVGRCGSVQHSPTVERYVYYGAQGAWVVRFPNFLRSFVGFYRRPVIESLQRSRNAYLSQTPFSLAIMVCLLGQMLDVEVFQQVLSVRSLFVRPILRLLARCNPIHACGCSTPLEIGDRHLSSMKVSDYQL